MTEPRCLLISRNFDKHSLEMPEQKVNKSFLRSVSFTLKICWFSQPSPSVQTKISIDVSGLPDQENRMSPDMILYFKSRLAW